MTARWLALIGLLAALAAPLGCKKSGDTTSAPDDYDYAYAEGEVGGGAPGYAMDGVATGSTVTRDAGAAHQREFANDYRDVDADYKAIDPEPEEAKPSGGKLDEPDEGKQDQPDHGRRMVYTATLQLAVYELDEAIEFAETIPERYGGWIQARYDYQITLRVPAVRLREIMDELSTLGLVLGKTLQASDVTAEYTDLESRIAVLEQMAEQLELLLKQAKTVEDSLKVRQELERVRIELEAAKTRFRQLAELVGFSTLTLHLSQRGADEALPSSNDPFPWVDELGVESTEFTP
jgi:hypothetical protein